MKNKTKKICTGLFCLIFFLGFDLNSVGAWGDSISHGDVTGVAQDITSDLVQRFGIDEGELRYQMQNFNVSRRKKQPPLVSLTFNPSDPIPGQKVTAIATPMYFLNGAQDLYFTWYLRPAGCSEDVHPDAEKRRRCDMDDNGEIDIEDYKIKAARIIASNDFEWDKDHAYDNHTDEDGYDAVWGGDDQKEKPEHCFIHDTYTGDEYEIECDDHLFPHSPGGETGDGSFTIGEEEFFHTNPNDPDTADTGNTDESNVAGLGMESFSWTYMRGDKVGVVVEGVSIEPTQEEDSSYRTMWAMIDNNCVVNEDADADYDLDPEVTESTGDYDPDGDGISDGTVTITTTVRRWIFSRAGNVATIRTRTEYSATVNPVTNGFEYNIDGVAETETDGDDEAGSGDAIYVPDVDQLQNGTIRHVHMSCPGYRGGDQGASIIIDPDTSLPVECRSADQIVNLDQNQLQVADFESSSDLNDCLNDNMVEPSEGGGKAQKLDINLTYSPEFPINDPTNSDVADSGSDEGDMLVVNSAITNAEINGYLNYQWEVYATDQNTPAPENWGTPLPKWHLRESTQTSGIGLDALKFRLNLDSDIKYIKVKLTVQEGAPLESPPSSNDYDIVVKEGHADVVIPIASSTDIMHVYDATARRVGDNNTETPIMFGQGETERCTAGMNRTVCPISKDQVISLSVDSNALTGFYWTIDGKPFQYTNCFFDNCSPERQTNVAYFPVLEDPGYRYTVTLTATNIETGQKINLNRVFEVVEPEIKLSSGDRNSLRPVLLGHYVDLDGQEWPDESENEYMGLSDTPIQIAPTFLGFSPNDTNFAWYVDGVEVTRSNMEILDYIIDANNNLTVPGKFTGNYSDVAIVGVYAPDNLTKIALNKYWRVPYPEFYEKRISKGINVAYVDSFPETDIEARAKPAKTKLLASMIGSLPGYLAFLFRIVLTAFVLLVSSRFIFSLFPSMKKQED